MILKSETYHFHRLDPTPQGGVLLTTYRTEGLSGRPAHPPPPPDTAGGFHCDDLRRGRLAARQHSAAADTSTGVRGGAEDRRQQGRRAEEAQGPSEHHAAMRTSGDCADRGNEVTDCAFVDLAASSPSPEKWP